MMFAFSSSLVIRWEQAFAFDFISGGLHISVKPLAHIRAFQDCTKRIQGLIILSLVFVSHIKNKKKINLNFCLFPHDNLQVTQHLSWNVCCQWIHFTEKSACLLPVPLVTIKHSEEAICLKCPIPFIYPFPSTPTKPPLCLNNTHCCWCVAAGARLASDRYT